MATSLLVQSGSAVLPIEYSFIYPPSGAAWAMDRFIPSSRQPQHWSRNYHGSQERRRSIGRRRGSPDSQEKDASSYRQGVTLRAEDLLVDSDNKLGSGSRISPANHLAPKPGCNADSETCNYCRLSESSEERESSTDDDRKSSPSPPKVNGDCRRLMRALSEDYNPPSRPIRRTSPGEYLRHKRDQMEKLRREEQLRDPPPRRQHRYSFQRCDSDPRLSRRQQHNRGDSQSRALTFASPTRNRIRQRSSGRRKADPEPPPPQEENRPRRSALAKNIAERRSRSKERRSSAAAAWNNTEESTPFLQRRASFRCAVCDCDIPFTNCVLCNAEAKSGADGASSSDVFLTAEGDLVSLDSEDLVIDGEQIRKVVELTEAASAQSENKELEEFYDNPTPVDSSASTSSKSESRGGFHIVKESPGKDSPQQKDKNSCHFCGKTAEEEEALEKAKSRSLSPDVVVQEKNQRKSPVYLKPEFDFEPEIIHRANPLVDEADVDVLPTAVGAFRRLSEEEFISTLNIHDAAKKGDLHVVKLLTKKDPKQMETVDERGWTPIHLAAAHGHTEVVKYLAMEGAHLAALDPSSYTAIHLASMNGHNSCLEVLLPMGVDVDSTTAEGFTALHLAVMNCHLECIQTLLQWGASLDKRDALGRGIQDMVEEYNLQEVAAFLRRFHKQLHNFKHMLDMMNREGRNTTEMPQEYMDILASIAEESGTE